MLKRNGRASVSAEKGQNEAAEKSKEDLRDQNGRQSIVNKYVYRVTCASDRNGEYSSLGVLSVSLLQLAVHTKKEDSNLAWTLSHKNLVTSNDFSYFKQQKVVSLFSVSFTLP